MAPAIRKRNILDNSHSLRVLGANITAYGRITKTTLDSSKHRNDLGIKAVRFLNELQNSRGNVEVQGKRPDTKKRKHKEEDNETSDLGPNDNLTGGKESTQLLPSKDTGCNTAKSSIAPVTPNKSRKKARLASQPSKPAASPTKDARTILEAFIISEPTRSSSRPQANHHTKDNNLPDDLLELIDLHSAFLNALSLFYAHNGTSTINDFHSLKGPIERIWGKKKIELLDIRRLIGTQRYSGQDALTTDYRFSLSLVEYRPGRYSIENDLCPGSPFSVDSLRELFEKNVRKIHSKGLEPPLASIRAYSETSFGSALSKGAERLNDIKSIARGSREEEQLQQTITARPASSQDANPGIRAMSLLDRIRAKEALAASLPIPPSAEELSRRAALMRLEEAIPVLELLAGKTQPASLPRTASSLYSSASASAALAALSSKISNFGGVVDAPAIASFTMRALVQHLQMSMRHPISDEEADKCVRLLAQEVLPEWVSIREVGRVVGVTFRGKISRQEWMRRLKIMTGDV